MKTIHGHIMFKFQQIKHKDKTLGKSERGKELQLNLAKKNTCKLIHEHRLFKTLREKH